MTTESPLIERPASVPFWRRPFRILRDNRRAFLIINAAAYGLALIGFVIGLLFPHLNARHKPPAWKRMAQVNWCAGW